MSSMTSPPPAVLPLLESLIASRSTHPLVGDRWLVALSGGPDSMALWRVAFRKAGMTDIPSVALMQGGVASRAWGQAGLTRPAL